MLKRFIETRDFTDWVLENLPEEAYLEFQKFLMEHPNQGKVIPGCGGVRKIRVAVPSLQRGKRGGARVIYLHLPEANRIYMLHGYAKGEKEELGPAEKKLLKRLADQLKSEVAESREATGQQ